MIDSAPCPFYKGPILGANHPRRGYALSKPPTCTLQTIALCPAEVDVCKRQPEKCPISEWREEFQAGLREAGEFD